MTIEGAIAVLQNLIDNKAIPIWAKPSLRNIKETVKAEKMERKTGKWKTGKPKKHGKYLVTRTIFGKYTTISIAIYGKMDDLEETKKVCWHDYDSDYGDYEVDNVIAWMELPELPEPFEKKEE